MTREEILSKAKPILFNTEMVKAILDGRKTVTRRVAQGVPITARCSGWGRECACFWWNVRFQNFPQLSYKKEEEFYFPYEVGDILYVRETWCRIGEGVDKIYFENPDVLWNGMIIYRADGVDLTGIGKWKPSIHMPKKAARIFLFQSPHGV